MARAVDSSETTANLADLVEVVQSGEQVVIASAGRPVAVLIASISDPGPRELGGWRDCDVWIGEGFDDPLPAALQSAFEDLARAHPLLSQTLPSQVQRYDVAVLAT